MQEFFWHTMETTAVEDALEANISEGLSATQVKEKLIKYGHNKIEEQKAKPLWAKFLEQLSDFMVIVLIIAAVISVFVGEGVDAIIIIAIVILNSILGIVQENKAEKSLAALRDLAAPEAKVLREGKHAKINSADLVPGDIITLEAGDLVPADARLIDASNLKIEEAALTGESVPAEKNAAGIYKRETSTGDRLNMVYSGTVVTYGRGNAIVTDTGLNTNVGQIAKMLQAEEDNMTPLQHKLAEVGKMLAFLAIGVCVIIFVLGIIQGKNPLEMFMTAISLAVAAIPEGLPAIVTIVLAVGVQRLVKKNAIIRKLPAVETLGSAGVICSDKTGTLTQNKMTVVGICSSYRDWEINAGGISSDDRSVIKLILEMASQCNDSIQEEESILGDPTEVALVIAAVLKGSDKRSLDANMPRVAEIPFDSDRKLMTTVHKLPEGGYRIITKGAPDVILTICSEIVDDGDVEVLSPEHFASMSYKNSAMANNALRVLGVAFKDVDEIPENITSEILEKDLTFFGLIGMIDPPRPEAAKAVKVCREAGIIPVMITGDHKDTAVAIAREIGILTDEYLAISGSEINSMDPEEFAKNIDKYRVFARVSPQHKVDIVKAWKDKGKIVAMTGDGVNDAPALKASDIGCAMGKIGTDVAKGAADMVLTDDNFATIVEAVREGRGIFANIKRAIQFLLSSNLGEILVLFLAVLMKFENPLIPIHLLWVNLVTDSLPAIALGMENADKNIMKKKPRDPEKSLFADGLWLKIALQGAMIGLLSLFAFIIGRKFMVAPDKETALLYGQTMAFATLSFSQLVHAFNVRSEGSIFKIGFLSNKYMVGAFLCTAIMQLAVLLVPGLQTIFKVAPLGGVQWLWVILLSILPLIIVELAKAITKFFRR